MPVPTVITDLSTTASSNSPAGTDSIGTSLDDFLRAHAAFIAQLHANKVETTAIGVTVQAYDAGLSSIAGLTTAADRMFYAKGSDDYTVATLTSAGRAILDDADASAQRTTLGLAIGTNVQAWDAGLDSLAALTTAADRMPYTKGSDDYTVATLTSAGRAILDDADASAQRSTLGLGTMATEAAADYAKKSADADIDMNNYKLSEIKTATFNSQATLTTTTGAVTIDWTAAQNYKQNEPTGGITYTFTAPPGPCHLQLLIDSDGTSTAQTITWPTLTWIGATWAGANNKKAIINFWYDGTNYYAMGANQV